MEFPVPRRRQQPAAGDSTDGRPLRRGADEHGAVDGFSELVAEIDDVLTDALAEMQHAVRDVVPLADVVERDDGYVLDVELPGVRRDDVSVEVAQGCLRITGERRERHRVGLLRHRTRTTGRFRLELTLPVDVDTDEVTASLDHGVLTVVVPKAVHARRRRIPVVGRE